MKTPAPLPTFSISIEAVRFSSERGYSVMHWEPFARLDDPSCKFSKRVSVKTVAELASIVASMLDEFGYDATAFVNLIDGRAPNGFKSVSSWGKNNNGRVHPHYVKAA